MSSGRGGNKVLHQLLKNADSKVEDSLFGSTTEKAALEVSVTAASIVHEENEEKHEEKEESYASTDADSDSEAELEMEVDSESSVDLPIGSYDDESEEQEEKESAVEASLSSINLHDPDTSIPSVNDLDDFITLPAASSSAIVLPRRRKLNIPPGSNSAYATTFPSHTPRSSSDLVKDEIILPGEHTLELKDRNGYVYFQSMYYLTNKNRRIHILDHNDPIKQKTDLIYHMSPVIQNYRMDTLVGMKTPQPNTLYLDARPDGLRYYALDSSNNVQQGIIEWSKLPKHFPQQTAALLSSKEAHIFAHIVREQLGENFAYDYKYLREKTGGINIGGAQTGVYEFFYTYRGTLDKNGNQHVHKQELLFKQDNGYKDTTRRTLNKGLAQLTKHSPLGPRNILHAKIIGEFVASRIMNALIGDSSSSIFYALVAPAKKPDRSGKNVYIGSIFYDQTDDLFRDMARVLGKKVPGVDEGVKNKRPRNVGTVNSDIYAAGLFETRPEDNAIIHFDKEGNSTYVRKPQKYAVWSPITQSIAYDYFNATTNEKISQEAALKLGGQPRLRYHDLERTKIASLFVGDFDMHAENEMNTAWREGSSSGTSTGAFDPKALQYEEVSDTKQLKKVAEYSHVVSDKIQLEIESEHSDVMSGRRQLKKDPEHKIGRINRIDQAAALHDLTDEIHPHSYQNHIPLLQVSNHFLELPLEIRVSRKMAEEADRQANFSPTILRETIVSALLETAEFYGATPIMEFMQRMGMRHIEKILIDKIKPADDSKAFYQKLVEGTLDEREDVIVKTILVQEAIEWLTNKMLARRASLRKMAFDIKMSLCIVKNPDGTFSVDNSEYNLADVILEYPEYANKEKLRLRNTDHYSGGIFTNKAARKTAIDAMEKALLQTATKIMGEQAAKADIRGYVMKHYAKPTPEEAAKLHLPTNVHRFVATRDTLKSEFKNLYSTLKTATPHLSTAAASKNVTLQPNEFALHFVETTTHGSKTACYVENVTRDQRHQITAHTLPPEIDPTEVFTQALIEACDPTILHSDRKHMETLRSIAKKLTIKNGKVDLSQFNASSRRATMLAALTALRFDYTNYTSILMSAYNAATLQTIGDKTIPCKSYLEYAEKQCQSLVLPYLSDVPAGKLDVPISKSDVPTIKIMPRKVEDPLLIQSYALVCKAFNWTFIDLSDYSKVNPNAVKLLVDDPAVINAVRSQLMPRPANPAPDAARHRPSL